MSGEISSSSSTDGSINSVAVVRPNQEEEEGGRLPSVATEVLRKEGKWGGSRGGEGDGRGRGRGGGGEGDWRGRGRGRRGEGEERVPQDRFFLHQVYQDS